MSLRYVRFYLFRHQSLLRTYPTPSTAIEHLLCQGIPRSCATFDTHATKYYSEQSCWFSRLQNTISLFYFFQLGFRFQHIRELDHYYLCNEACLLQLMCPLVASFNIIVSSYIIATASTRTTNLIDCNFHTIRYLINI